MSDIDPRTSLGELVLERPARAQLFEQLGFDYCCGGSQSLAEACGRRGLDPDTVGEVLAALDGAALTAPGLSEDFDPRRVSITELCDHIVSVHHEGLRRELPRIAELIATVVRVHGKGHRELYDLERVFTGMRGELERHLELEERALFPVCRALDSDEAIDLPIDAEVFARHEREHVHTGGALAALRQLAGDFDRSRALCGTHRRMLDALRRLEADIHRHVHEENNVLFPGVRALLESRIGPLR